jgi:type IV pilus assembly protein PilN
MKITLNLATRPYADQGPALKRLRIGMAVLVVLLAVLGLGLLHFHQAALRMEAQEAALDQSIARIGQEQNGYQRQMQEPDNAKVLRQAEFLNGLFDEKSFSWTAAMEDLERVLPVGVQVTAIEPARGKDGRVTLRLKVSGLRERSVEMVRNMERSRRFTNPRVAGENAESNNSQGDLQPVHDVGKVSFDILAEYNPATLEERKVAIAAQKRQRPDAAGQGSAGRSAGHAAGHGAGQARSSAAQALAAAGSRQQYAQPNPQAGPGPQHEPAPQPGMPPDATSNPTKHSHRPSSIPPQTQGGPQ